MESFASTLSQNIGNVALTLIVICVLLIAIVLRLWFMLTQIRRRFSFLFDGSTAESLEEQLRQHFNDRIKLKMQVDSNESRLDLVERKMQKSKRHVGLVRYDAFEDIGGQQSFAMALYDDNGDGVMVSSIIGRMDGRVYGKKLVAGKAERALGTEEQQAILDAVKQS